ncbi:MAG: hypothetical protein ABIQ39_11120 [Ilumatobacteraceae bacterium]
MDLTNFEVGTDGKLVTFSECAVECQPLATSIAITPACAPGPGCAAFASDSGGLMAMQRATISLRSPAITLLFHITAPQNVTGISDATGTVRYDGDTQYFSVTLPMAPPPGTATVATISFADGTTSKLTITYG